MSSENGRVRSGDLAQGHNSARPGQRMCGENRKLTGKRVESDLHLNRHGGELKARKIRPWKCEGCHGIQTQRTLTVGGGEIGGNEGWAVGTGVGWTVGEEGGVRLAIEEETEWQAQHEPQGWAWR